MKILDLVNFIFDRLDKIEELLKTDIINDPVKHGALVRLTAQVGEAFKYFRYRSVENETFQVLGMLYMSESGFCAKRDQLVHSYHYDVYQNTSPNDNFTLYLIEFLKSNVPLVRNSLQKIVAENSLDNMESEEYEARGYQGIKDYSYKTGDYLDFAYHAIRKFRVCFEKYYKQEGFDENIHLALYTHTQTIGQILDDFNGAYGVLSDNEFFEKEKLFIDMCWEDINDAYYLYTGIRKTLSHLTKEIIQEKNVFILGDETLKELYTDSDIIFSYIEKTTFFISKTITLHKNLCGDSFSEIYANFYELSHLNVFENSLDKDNTFMVRMVSIGENIMKLMNPPQSENIIYCIYDNLNYLKNKYFSQLFTDNNQKEILEKVNKLIDGIIYALEVCDKNPCRFIVDMDTPTDIPLIEPHPIEENNQNQINATFDNTNTMFYHNVSNTRTVDSAEGEIEDKEKSLNNPNINNTNNPK